MAFQPSNVSEDLYYPSGQEPLGSGLYSVAALHEAAPGTRLYQFDVGDYAYPSLDPIPHVEITIFNLDPACVTITVYRTAQNRTMPVPGQVNAYAVGGRNVVDWDAPFGIPVSYRAEQFDANGNPIGYTSAFTTQLNVEDTWVQNPFNPVGALQVTVASGAGATLQSPNPTDVYYASGSGTGIAISGQKRGFTDVPFSFLTFTEPDATKVRAMFGNPYESPSLPSMLVIRTGTGQNLRFPQPFYALIPEPAEMPLTTNQGGSVTRWECQATEIARPAPALVAAVLTYEDFDLTYPDTYESEDAAYATYLEADRDYSIAGTAGEQD